MDSQGRKYKPKNMVSLVGTLACIGAIQPGMFSALTAQDLPKRINPIADVEALNKAKQKRQRKLERNRQHGK